ncbi:site-specific DNA-methyltransferase [Rhizobiales bacterium TNE-4]|nr:site-specific DNA-methyltransferase [Rhizobiales bacterium TNE-4]MBV1826064.1 site-specific DNA-methyltransferase [Rhizobiales bacterium TNE-4]
MPTLDWIGKKAVVNHHREVPYRLLHCDREKSFGDPEAGNLLVQGDNLEALKALLPYYAGKVKCIYIDPPYNTGNESWVYNDNVNSPEIRAWLGKVVGKEAEDLSRHDKWLCMMYPRLRLLKEFLREDGSIWISIDDNEAHALKLICDEIFGRQNFIVNIVWQKKYAATNDSTQFSDLHDHILLYSKSAKIWLPNLIERSEKLNEKYANPDNDPRGPWYSTNLSVKTYSESYDYDIVSPAGISFRPPPSRAWVVSAEKYSELFSDNRIWFGKNGKSRPYKKTFLSEVRQGTIPVSFWVHEFAGHNVGAKSEIRKLFEGKQELFDTPKPELLLRRIIHIGSNPNDLVLDSFAGSGTTGAVAHKMGRRHISIEMGDHAKTHIVPRYQKVIAGEDQGGITESVNWQGGGGFRYCTLGAPLFDPEGDINAAVSFRDLAAHVFFCETGSPIPRRATGPLIGHFQGRAIYLLYARDSAGVANPRAGNVLNGAMLADLPEPKDDAAVRVVYAEGCTLSDTRLRKEGVIFKHIPYQIAGM